MNVISGKFNGERTVVIELVLDVSAALDFPAVVDIAAGAKRKHDCSQGNACFFVESQIHTPKVEIIFGLNVL